MKPVLEFKCSQNWENMQVGLISRHCESCRKDVIDFTRMSREEILVYLWERRNEKVCGRFYKSQLDFHHEEILATVEAQLTKHKNTNVAFYLLSMTTLFLMSCSSTPEEKIKPATNTIQGLAPPDETISDTTRSLPTSDTLSLETSIHWEIKNPIAVLGFTTIKHLKPGYQFADPILYLDGHPMLAQVMPEFVGGYDSLQSFIAANLKYPEWERRQGIQGTVYVTMLIDQNGKVTQPKITKGVFGAQNFDKEVLRIMAIMPDWTPAEDGGVPVSIWYNLPIRFKLNS